MNHRFLVSKGGQESKHTADRFSAFHYQTIDIFRGGQIHSCQGGFELLNILYHIPLRIPQLKFAIQQLPPIDLPITCCVGPIEARSDTTRPHFEHHKKEGECSRT